MAVAMLRAALAMALGCALVASCGAQTIPAQWQPESGIAPSGVTLTGASASDPNAQPVNLPPPQSPLPLSVIDAPSPPQQSFELLPEQAQPELAAPQSNPFGDAFSLDYVPQPQAWNTPASQPEMAWRLGGTARTYFIDDQRIEFTGQECTFAVEGAVDGDLKYQLNDWGVRLHGEMFLTEPFDRNILQDSPVRQSFANNFEIDPFTISQLYLEVTRGDWTFVGGKFDTPFGRYYYPLYRNNFDDSPFIRSDVILYRETGLLIQWHPEAWSCVVGVTNGTRDQDTNSSKAFIGRIGYDQPWFACGVSAKLQDGIGSEGQKIHNSYAGLDAMTRFGRMQLSGEVIADYYGAWRPIADPNDIFWGRSLYGREANDGNQPLLGVGYYVNLNWDLAPRMLTLNYGDYFPQQIGIPQQDTPIHRGMVKLSRHWTQGLQSYGVLILENSRPGFIAGKDLGSVYVLVGLQLSI
ncbi:MAG TPA: hypothetical protein VGJ15_12225 [Pirellulales bacterium]|jgi:hypothetical protein